MVYAWQQWLSARPLTRTNTSTQNTFYSAGNAAKFDILLGENGDWSLRETHYIENPRVKAGLSGPPLYVTAIIMPYPLLFLFGSLMQGRSVVLTRSFFFSLV
jgi:hypothetical protein